MKRVMVVLGGIVLAALLIGGGFFVGMNMGKAQAQSDQNAFFASRGIAPNAAGGGFPGGGTGGFPGGGTGAGATGTRRGGGVTGTVDKVDGNTITLTTAQGTTVTVAVTTDTPVLKSAAGTVSDIQAGTHLLVLGQQSGNNIAATGIQITDRPAGMENLFPGGAGGFGARPPPTPAK